MNLAELLMRTGRTTPDAVALITPDDSAAGDRTVTHGELVAGAEVFAAALVSDGVSPGDRVVICAPNTVGFVVAELGILAAGAVVVPVNPLAPTAELLREIDAVDAALVVCDPSVTLDAGDRRVIATPDIAAPDVATPDVAAPDVATPDVAAPDVAVPGGTDGSTPFDIVDRADDEPAALLFTSGTAGAPKAAILTHANLRSNLEQIQQHAGLALRPGDIGLGVLPFFHVFGLNVVLGLSLASGGTLVLSPFDDSTLERIARHGVTVIGGVPAMYQAWLSDDRIDASAFSSVRLAVSGAAALSVEVGTGFRDRFGVVVHQGYGLTETSPAVTTTALSDDPRPGSIGPPLPGVEVRLVDVDGSDVLEGDPGEIWVRGPNVFPGYWHDEDATANALTSDGWLRTGDIAVADATGELSLVDRSKDLVIVSGFNVFPAEVEDALREHPSVEDAAVLGEPDGRTGEAVVAYVVAAPGATVDAEELRTHAAGLLARYKCPTRIAVVESLPRTAIGKVLRRQLRVVPPA